MADEFHQRPDGLVAVRTATASYLDTAEKFAADFGETLAPLAAGADERIYTKNTRHALMVGGNVVAGGPMPWADGDRIIGKIADGLAAQKARQPAPPAPPEQPEPPPPAGSSISDRQFFQALALDGRITQAEALAAVKTGEIPAPLAAVIAAIPDEAERFAATMLLSGATTFSRTHPLVTQLADALGWSTQDVDRLWATAFAL